MARKLDSEVNTSLAGVLLAAGASRRLGRPKQLVMFHGQPLVVHAAKQALEHCDAGLSIVVGAGHDEVLEALKGLPVRIIHNPGWRDGIGSSIRQGVADVGPEVRAILLLLCDQPLITAADLGRLAQSWQNEPDRIAVAAYAGTCGVPAIFPRETWESLLNLHGDRGAKQIIEQAQNVTAVDMPNAQFDLDTENHLEDLNS